MCRVGGPRCDYDGRRAADKYRMAVAYRRQLASELGQRGVQPGVVDGVSLSALAEIARAGGLTPQSVFERSGGHGTALGTSRPCGLSGEELARVEVARHAYQPTPGYASAVRSSDFAISEAVEVLDECRNWVAEVRSRLPGYTEDGPEVVAAGHRALKDACLDEAVAEDEVRRRTERYLEDVSAAIRGERFVSQTTDYTALGSRLPDGVSVLHQDTQPDPAFITPLRALGLSDRTTDTGRRKPISAFGRDAALGAAGRRTELPAHDARVDELLLSLVDGEEMPTVSRVGTLIGSAGQNAFVDAVQYAPDTGMVAAAITNIGPVAGDRIPDAARARALYVAHVIGAPEAVVTAVVLGEPTVLRMSLDTATVEGTPDGNRFADLAPQIETNRADMRRLAALPSPMARRRIGEGKRDTEEAEANLAALLPMMGRFQVRRELARRRGVEHQSLDQAVRSMLQDHFDRSQMGVVVGVDGETASITGDPQRRSSPEYSDWIETGIVSHGSDRGETARMEKFHGVDQRIMSVNGTGAEHIHHISPRMVAGRPRFDDDHDDVRDMLLSGDVIVAHNVRFEQEHLLSVMPEICDQRPWLDTQWLATHFLPTALTAPDRTGGKLQHLVEDTGGRYSGEHRAGADAAMMMDALERLTAEPDWWRWSGED